MPLLRKVPLKLRLPLTHAALAGMAKFKSRGWHDARPQPGPLVVSGFFKESSGIAQAARLTVAALRDAGLAPQQHDLAPCYRQALHSQGALPDGSGKGVWLIHANAQECLIALMAVPESQWRHRYRIGYWAWETTRAAPLWAWAAQFFHEIWVPSQFVADALEQTFRVAGKPELSARVQVVPHAPADLSAIRPDRARFGLSLKGFEALCLFDMRSGATRKNPWAVVEAWMRAFPGAEPDRTLRLKIQHYDEGGPAQARLAAILAARPDIRLVTGGFDGDSMMSFMASFDALISLHRSEGFGLTLAEAMAMGVSTVATGWSGNMQFMNTDNSYLVPYKLIAVRDPAGLYGRTFGRTDPRQQWAEPDVDAAAAVLRVMVDDPAREAKRSRAREDIRALGSYWSAAAMAARPCGAYFPDLGGRGRAEAR